MARRNNILMFWAGYLAGGLVFGLPQAIGRHEDRNEARDRLRETQVHNEQLDEELEHEFAPVTHLSLDGKDSFSFETMEGQTVEVCIGNYEVEADTARVSGEIACTRTIDREGEN